MSWILLTNDDGVDSPALVPFARALARLAEVRIVVPDSERSWTGKAITRRGEVTATRVERDGLEVWACSGYPADAAQLGVAGVFEDGPPQLAVSGINLGFNHGASFLLSSGTVGAALEARIAGVPAVAMSTGLVGGDFREWLRLVKDPASAGDWRRLAEVCVDLLADVRTSGALDLADVVSVNLPFDADADTPRQVTDVARVTYAQLFRGVGDGRFAHSVSRFETLDEVADNDLAAATAGHVSITPLRMPAAATLPEEVRASLERR